MYKFQKLALKQYNFDSAIILNNIQALTYMQYKSSILYCIA